MPAITKHKLTVYYSIDNGGDGSSYPVFFETKKLAELHQEYVDEPLPHVTIGELVLTSNSPIQCKEAQSREEFILQLEEDGEEWLNSKQAMLLKKLRELK